MHDRGGKGGAEERALTQEICPGCGGFSCRLEGGKGPSPEPCHLPSVPTLSVPVPVANISALSDLGRQVPSSSLDPISCPLYITTTATEEERRVVTLPRRRRRFDPNEIKVRRTSNSVVVELANLVNFWPRGLKFDLLGLPTVYLLSILSRFLIMYYKKFYSDACIKY